MRSTKGSLRFGAQGLQGWLAEPRRAGLEGCSSSCWWLCVALAAGRGRADVMGMAEEAAVPGSPDTQGSVPTALSQPRGP